MHLPAIAALRYTFRRGTTYRDFPGVAGKVVLVVYLVFLSSLSAFGEESANSWRLLPHGSLDQMRSKGYPTTTIIPIFSQLLSFSFPSNFKGAYEGTNVNSRTYTWEAVLRGETISQWSQMITVTGAQGLAANPNVSPETFLARIAAGFKSACTDTFSAKGIGAQKITGYDAFVALAGCGSVRYDGTPHSEAALLVSIKGSSDYYTIQWAERGAALGRPIDLNDAKWQDRLNKLNPIKVCVRVSGESAPYPSCLNPK